MQIFLMLFFGFALSIIFLLIVRPIKKHTFSCEIPVKIILITKDSEGLIECFLRTFIHQLKKLQNTPFLPPEEFWIVDTGSQDKTYTILKKISQEYPFIHIISAENHPDFLFKDII